MATREQNLIAAGVYTAASLRTSSREAGVPGVGDFLNGLLLAALMLDFNEAGEGDFIEIFGAEAEEHEKVLSSATYREVKDEISDHVLAEVAGDKTTQSQIVAWASEPVIKDVAADVGLDKEGMLRMFSFCIIAVVCAVSAPENRVEHLAIVLKLLQDKREAGDMVA